MYLLISRCTSEQKQMSNLNMNEQSFHLCACIYTCASKLHKAVVKIIMWVTYPMCTHFSVCWKSAFFISLFCICCCNSLGESAACGYRAQRGGKGRQGQCSRDSGGELPSQISVLKLKEIKYKWIVQKKTHQNWLLHDWFDNILDFSACLYVRRFVFELLHSNLVHAG